MAIVGNHTPQDSAVWDSSHYGAAPHTYSTLQIQLHQF